MFPYMPPKVDKAKGEQVQSPPTGTVSTWMKDAPENAGTGGGEAEVEKRNYQKVYTVYNACQIEGIEFPEVPKCETCTSVGLTQRPWRTFLYIVPPAELKVPPGGYLQLSCRFPEGTIFPFSEAGASGGEDYRALSWCMSVQHYISSIVGSLHVSASYIDAVRAVITKWHGGRAAFLRTSDANRHLMMRQCVYAHWENRDLYRWIQYRMVEPKPACLVEYADRAEVA